MIYTHEQLEPHASRLRIDPSGPTTCRWFESTDQSNARRLWLLCVRFGCLSIMHVRNASGPASDTDIQTGWYLDVEGTGWIPASDVMWALAQQLPNFIRAEAEECLAKGLLSDATLLEHGARRAGHRSTQTAALAELANLFGVSSRAIARSARPSAAVKLPLPASRPRRHQPANVPICECLSLGNSGRLSRTVTDQEGSE